MTIQSSWINSSLNIQKHKNLINNFVLIAFQIEDQQYNMNRMEKEHNRMEDILRQELSDLQIVSVLSNYF